MKAHPTLYTVLMHHDDGTTTMFYAEDDPDVASMVEGWVYNKVMEITKRVNNG